jgi:hypothetical protein
VKVWATGKIEDTPHGCFAKMMREDRKPESEAASRGRSSRVPMDHYNSE